MKKIWEFYENLNEVVYVSDMDTYEMVYINRYGREKIGIQSLDEIQGQPCYKLLQNCSEPCSFCTNSKLKVGEFCEWKYYNEMFGKMYSLKDTMILQDGRKYRMELSVEFSDQEEQERTIEEFISNEALVNQALHQALAEPTPDGSINVLLHSLGQSLKSERVYIFEETAQHTFKNTYEWCAVGVEPQIDSLQDVPFEAVRHWYDSFYKNENVIIKNLENIKESNPLTYEYLQPQQINSLVVSPIIVNDEIIGFYGVDNPPESFLNHISIMFMVLGHFISSILKRRDLVRRLENLSYRDQLTGAFNRHGMNNFVEHVDHDASIGLVYCDVMGLKIVNDTKGHLAGDALLIQAYECLTSIFPENTVFRVGGDEFLVMGSNVSREDMEEKIGRLKQEMPNFSVNMAIGWVWEPHCNGRISELLKIADHRMYDDKEEYYMTHPDKRHGPR